MSEDLFEGGWRCEKAAGKKIDKPVTPRTCTKCQFIQRNEQQEEPDRIGWCESCLEGKPGPGTDPEDGLPRMTNVRPDVERAFFG